VRKITTKASAELQQAIEGRLNWAQTAKQLGQ
jgi:hypothetical protein